MDCYNLGSTGEHVLQEEPWENPPDETGAGMFLPRDGRAWNGTWGDDDHYDPMGFR